MKPGSRSPTLLADVLTLSGAGSKAQTQGALDQVRFSTFLQCSTLISKDLTGELFRPP
jgi:hypothetical protein